MKNTTNLENLIKELMAEENCTREFAIMVLKAMADGANATGTAHLIFK